MKKTANHINFEQVMSRNPLVLRTIRNFMGQRILLVENPVHGDEYPVIAVCPDYLVSTEEGYVYGVAENTTFFDCDDMYRGSDYEPLFINGKLVLRYELNK
jgi:hypothetical protein